MPSPSPKVPPGATFAVGILTALNLLNYLDRYIPSAVKDLFKRDLGLTDTQTSLPLTAFVLVYMIASPIMGTLADRWPRKRIIAMGVALWSFATAAAALAHSFAAFLIARALVGVGEAAYATLSPSILSDYFPPERRNRVLTIFYVAIPVGSAFGFALGGYLGEHYGWRAAFLACGLPGLLAASAALAIQEPPRGHFDTDGDAKPPSWPEALRLLRVNRPYVAAVAGYTAVTFASGALADWFPTFLVRHRGFSLGDAGLVVGASAVIGGLGGTVTGGFLADRLGRWLKQPYFALCAASTVVAAACVGVVLHVESRPMVIGAMLGAQFFFWFYNAPVNAILVNSVSSGLRVRAFSLSILLIHLLGDASSPALVGFASERIGLQSAVWIVPAAMLVGAAIWGAMVFRPGTAPTPAS